MHGKIDVENTTINVSGFSNWYPIGFIGLWYSFLIPTFRFDINYMFLLAPAIIFGVIYIIQSRKYNKIVNYLSEFKLI